MGIIVVGVIGWGVTAYNKANTAKQIAETRRWAGLAPLPASAADVRVFENPTFTWTGYYLRFRATSGQINAFLAASPGLKGKQPEVFSPKNQYLPMPKQGTDMGDPNVAAHSYFFEALWFNRAVRQSGRKYKVNWQGNSGEVAVDDSSHVVYVYVYDS